MTHDYVNCGKALEDCRWCLAKAEKLCRENIVDVQELDNTLTFAEQELLEHLQPSEDDGIPNEHVRQLMGLGKKGSKKKPALMKISRILEALEEMGAPLSTNQQDGRD